MPSVAGPIVGVQVKAPVVEALVCRGTRAEAVLTKKRSSVCMVFEIS